MTLQKLEQDLDGTRPMQYIGQEIKTNREDLEFAASFHMITLDQAYHWQLQINRDLPDQ